jgi:hypothetical protein
MLVMSGLAAPALAEKIPPAAESFKTSASKFLETNFVDF